MINGFLTHVCVFSNFISFFFLSHGKKVIFYYIDMANSLLIYIHSTFTMYFLEDTGSKHQSVRENYRLYKNNITYK